MYIKLAIVLLAMAAGALAQSCECTAANMETCVTAVTKCHNKTVNATLMAKINSDTWSCETETTATGSTGEHNEKHGHHHHESPLRMCAKHYKCEHESKPAGTEEKPHDKKQDNNAGTRTEPTAAEKQAWEAEMKTKCECVGNALGRDTSHCAEIGTGAKKAKTN